MLICLYQWVLVTPYAGVWIEIVVADMEDRGVCVTPYAGVWIEIFYNLLSNFP